MAQAVKPTQKVSEFQVKSRFIHITPDKIRLVAKAVIGKSIIQALNILPFIQKSAKVPIMAILKEAQSRAKDLDLIPEKLYIKIIRVDEGPKLKRRRIILRGRATSILKRMSHITVVLSAQPTSKIKDKKLKMGSKNERKL